MKRAEIVAIGSVQGVGLRYQVDMMAKQLGLSGHVKNSDDGTVEIICEGSQDAINTLIDKMLALKIPINVEDVKVTYSDPQGLTRFEIVLEDEIHEWVEGFETYTAYWRTMIDKYDQMLDKWNKTTRDTHSSTQK